MPRVNAEYKDRSVEELRKASEVIRYELRMLETIAAGLMSGIGGTGALQNALLESFAIHSRALIHFFYLEKHHRTDIVAAEFFADPILWRSRKPRVTPTLKRAKRMADKQVAHMTEERLDLTAEVKTWDIHAVAGEILGAYTAFQNLGCHHKLGSSWQVAPDGNDPAEL